MGTAMTKIKTKITMATAIKTAAATKAGKKRWRMVMARSLVYTKS
jgi:hypothetical protein